MKARQLVASLLERFACVGNGTVVLDVRGAWPVAIVGMHAVEIRDMGDFMAFIGSKG